MNGYLAPWVSTKHASVSRRTRQAVITCLRSFRRLLERGIVPFQVFASTRYIRSKDLGAFLQTHKNTPGPRKGAG